MLLGKRPRPPIKRTTSMTGITVDVPSNVDSSEPSDHHHHHHHHHHPPHATHHEAVLPPPHDQNLIMGLPPTTTNVYDQRFLAATISPRHRTRNVSNDLIETAHFLRTCGLCNRRLAPGRDIYMYRGDTAFCSSECREQQMKQDERKEKLGGGVGSKKKEDSASSRAASSASKNETLAAA